MPRVSYNGLIADVREEDLQDALASLTQCSRKERRQILASVRKALDGALRAVEAGEELSAQQMQDAANDIGLWFAGEVLAGRAEQYRVEMQ